MDWTAISVGIGLSVIVVWFEWRGIRPIMGGSVVRHLERDGSFRVRTGRFSNMWTPSFSSPTDRLARGYTQILGTGWATYTLDTAGTVRLRWEGKRGRAHEYSGAVPATAAPEVRGRMHRIVWVVGAIYIVFGGLGAVVGAFMATSTVSVKGAVIGLIVGLFAGYLTSATVSAGMYLREVRKLVRRHGE